jgi:hypothetical protein
LELAGRHRGHLSRHDCVHPQVGKTAPDKATGEGNKLWACFKVLTVTGSLGQKLERIILQDIDTLMIGAKVVNLFPENCHPKIFADEFEEVKFVLELWVVFS